MDRRQFTTAFGLTALGDFRVKEISTPSGDAADVDLGLGEVSVLAFIPQSLWASIRDESIPDSIDLGPDLQRAIESGHSLLFPAGKYPYVGTLKPLRGQNIRGVSRGAWGKRTLLKETGGREPAILLDGGGETTISALRLEGPTTTPHFRGVGLQIGDQDFSGIYTIREISVENFEQNIRLRGALWTSFYDVHSLNGVYGLTLDSVEGKYNTTCLFMGCSFRENLRQGFVGLRNPVRSVIFNFFGCDFESNCSADTRLPQVQPGALAHATFVGCYFEDQQQRVDGVRLDACGGVNFDTCYFNGGHRHIVAGDGSSNNVRIGGGTRFLGTAAEHAVEMPGCLNVVVESTIETDKPLLLSGHGAGRASVTAHDEAEWTPMLIGSGIGQNPPQSKTRGRFTQIGRRIFLDCEIQVGNWGGLGGRLSIGGLPFPRARDGFETVLAADHQGLLERDDTANVVVTIAPGDAHLILYRQQPGGSRSPLVLERQRGPALLRISGSYGI